MPLLPGRARRYLSNADDSSLTRWTEAGCAEMCTSQWFVKVVYDWRLTEPPMIGKVLVVPRSSPEINSARMSTDICCHVPEIN